LPHPEQPLPAAPDGLILAGLCSSQTIKVGMARCVRRQKKTEIYHVRSVRWTGRRRAASLPPQKFVKDVTPDFG